MAALATGHEEAAGDLLANLEAGVFSAGAELDDDTSDLVTEDGGQREGNGTSDDMEVGVTQAARGHLDEDFTGLGARRADGFDLEALVVVA